MKKLSHRLSAVAGMVTPGLPVTDVGCDHAWLPIYLTEMRIVPSAVACDLRQGPLQRAEEHIREAHLEERIRTVLCDGVPKAALTGTLVISGMGGLLAAGILKDAGEWLRGYSSFVFGVQSDLMVFRRTLQELGLLISEEQMIVESGKVYAVIGAVHGAGKMTEEELLFGPVLLRRKDPLLFEYLERQKSIQKSILGRLTDTGHDDQENAGIVKEKLKLISEAEKRYEMS